MSIRLMGAVFELDIPACEKLVLLAMADFARDDGTGCYPSIVTLAKKTSQSRRGVQKIARRLELQGLIVPSKVSRGRRSTEYKITLENREQGSLFVQSQPRTPVHPTANLSACNREPGSPEPLGTTMEPLEGAAQAASRPSPFAFGGARLQVSEKQDQLLAEAFPWVDRPAEYRKAESWLEANATRRPRKSAPFLHNWFTRIQAPGPNGKGGIDANERTRRNLVAAGLRPN